MKNKIKSSREVKEIKHIIKKINAVRAPRGPTIRWRINYNKILKEKKRK